MIFCEKIEKDVLTLKTRGADGKFAKPLALKLTGTRCTTMLVTQSRDVDLTQKETGAKALEAKQAIAVIYAEDKNDAVRCPLSWKSRLQKYVGGSIGCSMADGYSSVGRQVSAVHFGSAPPCSC